MGLDTRAYRRADDRWRGQWAQEVNATGDERVMFGLLVRTYDRIMTPADAPSFHQDGLDALPWPGGLVGSMLSGHGGGPSFRGKSYVGYCDAVGIDLFAICDEPLEGLALAHAVQALQAAVDDPPFIVHWLVGSAHFGGHVFTPEEAREHRQTLADWFAVCSREDLVVAGDY